jgi:hypothetical protein
VLGSSLEARDRTGTASAVVHSPGRSAAGPAAPAAAPDVDAPELLVAVLELVSEEDEPAEPADSDEPPEPLDSEPDEEALAPASAVLRESVR